MNTSHRAHGWLHRQLEEWQAEGLVTASAAAELRERYPLDGRERRSWGRIIVGILGSLLMSGGVLLLFAHNWYEFGRPLRAGLAIAPLLVFQLLGGWTLWQRPGSTAWREGVAAGLTLSIGAAIALVAQTYQLGGDFGRFMLMWILLTLPVVYLFRSGVAVVLFLAGTVIHAAHEPASAGAAATFLVLLASALPFVRWTGHGAKGSVRDRIARTSLAAAFWIGAPLALEGTWEGTWLPLLALAAGAMVLWDQPKDGRPAGHSFRPFALGGALFLGGALLTFSFEGAWRELGALSLPAGSGQVLLLAVLGCLAAGAWVTGLVHRGGQGRMGVAGFAGATGVLFVGGGTASGLVPPGLLMLATNLTGFALGLVAIASALRQHRLAVLNAGLLLIVGLILLRFFDAELGFVVRGAGFIGLGGTLLAANYLFLRRCPPSVPQPHPSSSK